MQLFFAFGGDVANQCVNRNKMRFRGSHGRGVGCVTGRDGEDNEGYSVLRLA